MDSETYDRIDGMLLPVYAVTTDDLHVREVLKDPLAEDNKRREQALEACRNADGAVEDILARSIELSWEKEQQI